MSLGILKYCLREMLCKKQRETFFFFLDTMSKVLRESHEKLKLNELEQDVNKALALLERDFPVSKQVHISKLTNLACVIDKASRVD